MGTGATRRAQESGDRQEPRRRRAAVPVLATEHDRAAVLDRATVAAFVADLLDGGNERATARSRHLSLHRFSAWLVEEGEADEDRLYGSRPPKLDAKVVEPLTEDDLRALLKACAGPDMRDRRDEDCSSPTLTSWPGPLSSAAARAALAASCRSGRSQVAASTDTLRHTAAHRWLAAGGSEGGLMAVAGWTRPDMLLRYTKARASERAAEEARALNLGTCERARRGYRRVPALPFGRCASSRGCGVMPPWRVCPRPPRVLAPPGGRSWTGSRAMIGRRRGSR